MSKLQLKRNNKGKGGLSSYRLRCNNEPYSKKINMKIGIASVFSTEG